MSWSFKLEGAVGEEVREVLAEAFRKLTSQKARLFQARFYDGVNEENWLSFPPEAPPQVEPLPPEEEIPQPVADAPQDGNPESVHDELVRLGEIA